MHPGRLRRLTALCLLTGTLCLVQAQQGPANAPAQPPASPAQTTEPPSGPQNPLPAAKPRISQHKVITNDDLNGKSSILYSQQAGIDLSSINDCDRNCFEQVRQAAHLPAGPNTHWKHDLLGGIEKVRADGEWQARLAELAQVKGKYCDLENSKNEDLARNSDPKNVTEDEISIEEMYQRKFETLQSDLLSAESHADQARRNYSGIVVEFMYLQQQRIVNATCPNSYRRANGYYPRGYE